MGSTKQTNFIYNSSFLSSQELRVDKKNNLKISTFSLTKNESNTIPLDLIEAMPKITKYPNMAISFVATACVIASASLYLSAFNTGLISAQIVATLLLSVGIISFAFSLTKPIITYSFSYKNTSIDLFKLRCSSRNDEHIQRFVEQLIQRIENIDSNTLENVKSHNINNLESDFIGHLDFLYNHGMVNDIVYDRISDKINEKIYGIKPHKLELAEVILLPVKSV